jgi:DNA-binding NtrC family response regulator
VLADLRLPGMSGVDLLARLKERDPALPVLLLTGHGTIDDAVSAMRLGALDFLTKPVEPDVIIARLRKAVERGRIERERDRLRGPGKIVAESPAMRGALRLIEQVAAQPSTVLLTGESGTGKEVLAAYLHEKSPRRVGPFVKVNCAAVPAALFEAEFFGAVRGAYTGAGAGRAGWFAQANGGTLFLDEVGALAPEGQSKLLRALESGEVRPVGATETVRVDVRIVAATNEDLEKRRDAGTFRADLFYRLAVFPVRVPPLRERPADLEPLARRFASPLRLGGDAPAALRRHTWPGNVRELRNVIERARILAEGDEIAAADIEPQIPSDPDDLDLKRRVADLERDLFQRALRRTGGKKSQAARLLGIDPSNWAYHAKRLNLQ